MSAPGTASATERHATNLELFLDLVFVFAVTQIASMVDHSPTLAGVARAVLISWLVWWQWSQFTWAGSAVDLQQSPRSRVLVLCTIPATLTMAVSIPGAFGHDGRWFGCAYLAVQLLVLAMQGAVTRGTGSAAQAFVTYVSVAAIAPVVVLAGGFVAGPLRTWLWVAAGLIHIISGLRGAAAGEWVINQVHFAERHALFVIISLGEALVAIGAAATSAGLTSRTFAGLVAAAALACVLWWTYFAFIPHVAEKHLGAAAGAARGVAARDLFTFGHFPIVAGIIAFSIVIKHMVPEPTATLAPLDRWLLGTAVALVIVGYLHIQCRVARRQARERYATIIGVGLLCGLGGSLSGLAIVGTTAVLLGAMQGLVSRSFRTSEFAVPTHNR